MWQWTSLKLSKTMVTITLKNLFVRRGRLLCHLRINQTKIRSADIFSWPCRQNLRVTNDDLCVMLRFVCSFHHVMTQVQSSHASDELTWHGTINNCSIYSNQEGPSGIAIFRSKRFGDFPRKKVNGFASQYIIFFKFEKGNIV